MLTLIRTLDQAMAQFYTLVQTLKAAAEQQSATSEEINQNVSEINSLSGQMSQDIQAANVRIREVASMSRDLAQLVEKFRSEE